MTLKKSCKNKYTRQNNLIARWESMHLEHPIFFWRINKQIGYMSSTLYMHVMYTFPCKMPSMKARVHVSMQMITTVISFQKMWSIHMCTHTYISLKSLNKSTCPSWCEIHPTVVVSTINNARLKKRWDQWQVSIFSWKYFSKKGQQDIAQKKDYITLHY